jgi:hypothetical protein
LKATSHQLWLLLFFGRGGALSESGRFNFNIRNADTVFKKDIPIFEYILMLKKEVD